MYHIEIRGHHLWNLKNIFQRFGPLKFNPKNYSDFYEFYKNRDSYFAQAVYMKIIENPHLKITITDFLDDICTICGSHDGIKCTKEGEDENELKMLDRKTAQTFGFQIGESCSSDDLLFRLSKYVDV